VAEVPGLIDVRNTVEQPREELVFRPDRAALADAGLTVGQVGSAIRAALEGEVAGVFRSAGEELDIRVRYPAGTPASARSRSASSASPRPQGASPSPRWDPRTRGDRPRHPPGEPAAELRCGGRHRLGEPHRAGRRHPGAAGRGDPPARLQLAGGGEFEDFGDAFAAILEALALAIILTYIVLAMILESFVRPLTIMVTLPLGMAGGFLGLMLAGVPLNIFAMMAVVMLVGIVVNNAILILDYAGQEQAKGKSAADAVGRRDRCGSAPSS
jgi:hydrophobic/amphiphilic exporter-1 (mainly G- bacteria), HAE1 family